ncbi:MAG: tetratricopeptide repeat protein [Myxococcales bacterium]|nr:tetratricopeptide repeat protein [Myxococcales bacterium]
MGTANGALHAQEPPEPAAEARRHFDAGTRMFAKGRLNEALVEFEAANRIKPDPALLYDLAETHRALGHDASALAFYRAFLEAAPYTPKREEVDAKVHLLVDSVKRRDSELWTIVGAVAAAGIATTVVLTSPQVPSTNQGSFAF